MKMWCVAGRRRYFGLIQTGSTRVGTAGLVSVFSQKDIHELSKGAISLDEGPIEPKREGSGDLARL